MSGFAVKKKNQKIPMVAANSNDMKYPDGINTFQNYLDEFKKINISDYTVDLESVDYEGSTLSINGKRIVYRTAKVTPKKVGLFVAIWKRDSAKKTCPFDFKDDFDYYVIHCSDDEEQGVFIFSKKILLDRKIISGLDSKGKRGFRIYPSWSKTISSQATRSQKWQLDHFINYNKKNEVNKGLIQSYFLS